MRTIISQVHNVPTEQLDPKLMDVAQKTSTRLKTTTQALWSTYSQLQYLQHEWPALQTQFQSFLAAIETIRKLEETINTILNSSKPSPDNSITEHDLDVDRFRQEKNDWRY